MNAPDRYEKFVVPEGVNKYVSAAYFSRTISCLHVWEHLKESVLKEIYAGLNKGGHCIHNCRIDYQRDTKQQNAGTFIIQREDHTVGNLLRM